MPEFYVDFAWIVWGNHENHEFVQEYLHLSREFSAQFTGRKQKKKKVKCKWSFAYTDR